MSFVAMDLKNFNYNLITMLAIIYGLFRAIYIYSLGVQVNYINLSFLFLKKKNLLPNSHIFSPNSVLLLSIIRRFSLLVGFFIDIHTFTRVIL